MWKKIPINESIFTEKVENIVAKRLITRSAQFLLLSQCFQNCLLQRRQKTYICGKGLIEVTANTSKKNIVEKGEISHCNAFISHLPKML